MSFCEKEMKFTMFVLQYLSNLVFSLFNLPIALPHKGTLFLSPADCFTASSSTSTLDTTVIYFFVGLYRVHSVCKSKIDHKQNANISKNLFKNLKNVELFNLPFVLSLF